MKNKYPFSFFVLILLSSVVLSCAGLRARKRAEFYFNNRTQIDGIVATYNTIDQQQHMLLGAGKRNYKCYGIDIMTDTIRIAFDSRPGKNFFFEQISPYYQDTAAIRGLLKQTKAAGCLWIGREYFQFKGRREQLLFLSFRSARNFNSFLDRKYFTLVFGKADLFTSVGEEAMKALGYKMVNDSLFAGTTENYRRHHL
jgi:hypothetical protein